MADLVGASPGRCAEAPEHALVQPVSIERGLEAVPDEVLDLVRVRVVEVARQLSSAVVATQRRLDPVHQGQ